MITVQQIIDKRLFLTDEQQESLISLLTFKQREAIRREIVAKVKFNFFTLFDGSSYSTKLVFDKGICSLNSKDYQKELNKLRDYILGAK
jgi:hypothetical protein